MCTRRRLPSPGGFSSPGVHAWVTQPPHDVFLAQAVSLAQGFAPGSRNPPHDVFLAQAVSLAQGFAPGSRKPPHDVFLAQAVSLAQAFTPGSHVPADRLARFTGLGVLALDHPSCSVFIGLKRHGSPVNGAILIHRDLQPRRKRQG